MLQYVCHIYKINKISHVYNMSIVSHMYVYIFYYMMTFNHCNDQSMTHGNNYYVLTYYISYNLDNSDCV